MIGWEDFAALTTWYAMLRIIMILILSNRYKVLVAIWNRTVDEVPGINWARDCENLPVIYLQWRRRLTCYYSHPECLFLVTHRISYNYSAVHCRLWKNLFYNCSLCRPTSPATELFRLDCKNLMEFALLYHP